MRNPDPEIRQALFTGRTDGRGPRRWPAAAALALLLALLLAPPAGAGELPFELEIFDEEHVTTELNLPGAMLDMVAGSLREEDAGFAEMISGLEGVWVRVTEFGDDEAMAASARRQVRDAAARLDEAGWSRIVRLREDDEEVYLYLLQRDGRVGGMVALFTESDEAGMIHIDGEFDPAQLGRIGAALDIEGLEGTDLPGF